MGRPRQIKLETIRYGTINSCLAAFFDCSPKELPSIEGHFEWVDAEGDYHYQSVQEAMNSIRKRNVWAWVENKRVIHYFVRRKATFRQVLKSFAHEIGHMRRPFHKTLAEEQKAERYADVAAAAYDAAVQITKEYSV